MPVNSLFMIPVSIMTKIPMKRTDDPSIHMKQILRPFSSSQVKKDWIFKHTSSGFIPLNGFGTAWQNCKLGLWLYQLWSLPENWHFERDMLKVRQNRNVFFFKPMILPKKPSNYGLTVLWSNCFALFFEEFKDSKKSFWNLLTYKKAC